LAAKPFSLEITLMVFCVWPTLGNDDNSGTKLSPWRTQEHARRTAKPGDEIWINDGRGFVRLESQRPDNGRAHDA
jgi:hypothetical protein